MNEYQIDITITLQGPILTKDSGPGTFGIDASFARDTNNNLILPATLVRGRFRDAVEQLALTPPATNRFAGFSDDWLGVESGKKNGQVGEGEETEAGSYGPHRRRLEFTDFKADVAPDRDGLRHNIAINSKLGSVSEGMLRVAQMPFGSGAKVPFKGSARFFANDIASAKEVAGKIRIGLHWITQFGAGRSVGFGRVIGMDVPSPRLCRASDALFDPARNTWDALAIDLHPHGAICVSKPKIGDNLFESEDILPGNVIAGAVAETWAAMLGRRLNDRGVAALEDTNADRKLLADNFDKIRFRHAFPSPVGGGTGRPRCVPLSIIFGKDIGARDAARFKQPLVFNSVGEPFAPAFRTDWKGEVYTEVDPKFGWALPERRLSVRTAINWTRKTAYREEGSEEGKLFAEEQMLPHDGEGNTIVWRSWVDLDGVDAANRDAVARALLDLLSRLRFLSKTKTACDVRLRLETRGNPGSVSKGDTVYLALQTPALLCDPRFQDVQGAPKSGALTSEELHKLYASVWNELSDNSLTLSHYFASQSLAGGKYLHNRFQVGKKYRPWLLTDAGSLFVFVVEDPKKYEARVSQHKWFELGLPLPGWAKREFGEKWNENPYRRENGFGEIAIHIPGETIEVVQDSEIYASALNSHATTGGE